MLILEIPSKNRLIGPEPFRLSQKDFTTIKAFIVHAASLRQGFPHCAISHTAASRRSLGRISVPVWPTVLSDRLPITALVGHYPTNKLIGREPLPKHARPKSKRALVPAGGPTVTLSGISYRFQ